MLALKHTIAPPRGTGEVSDTMRDADENYDDEDKNEDEGEEGQVDWRDL